jgi:hypothetical protein
MYYSLWSFVVFRKVGSMIRFLQFGLHLHGKSFNIKLYVENWLSITSSSRFCKHCIQVPHSTHHISVPTQETHSDYYTEPPAIVASRIFHLYLAHLLSQGHWYTLPNSLALSPHMDLTNVSSSWDVATLVTISPRTSTRMATL